MNAKLIIPAVILLPLSACDAASEIAGDALNSEIRSQVVAQCEAVAENAAIVADRITAVCECSANTFMDDPELTVNDIRPERIEGIVNDCARETGEPNSAETAEESSV